jgi:TnsA endonuclease N terminal/TnsA endonuclease C terminal
MAKRNRASTRKKTERLLKKGRGQGRGIDYKPFLNIQDVPSQGLATRDRGWHTGRVHHFMSLLEWKFFFLLEWSTVVLDIREQFPLDLETTLAIAHGLGIPHPADRKTREPSPVTSDIVVTVKLSIGMEDQVWTVKPAKKLSDIRTAEKLEIERVYWSYSNTEWAIVTDLDIDPILSRNVQLIHPFRNLHLLKTLTAALIKNVEEVVVPRLHAEDLPLVDITTSCDSKLGLKQGSSVAVVYHLIATRRLLIDMGVLIVPDKRLVLK